MVVSFPNTGAVAFGSLDTPWVFSVAGQEEVFHTYMPCGLCSAHGAEAWLAALRWWWGLPGSGPWSVGRGWARGKGETHQEGPLREGPRRGSEGNHSHLHRPKSAVSAKPGHCPPGPGLCPERTAESSHKKSVLPTGLQSTRVFCLGISCHSP